MADELILKLKIETEESSAKLEDVNQQMDKIKKNSKETGDGFAFADTKIGKMWTTFMGGAQKAIASMATLKGAIAATGIGLLLIAITSLVSYFTKTERGAEKLKVIMAALGQVINTVVDTVVKLGETLFKIGSIIAKVVTGNKNLKDGFNEAKDAIKTGAKEIGDAYGDMGNKIDRAIALAERENQLRKDKRQNMIDEAKLRIIIADGMVAAADATKSNTERIKELSTAQAAQNKLYEEKIRIAKEEYEQIKEKNSLSESTQDDLDKEAAALANVITLQAEMVSSTRRMVSQRTGLEKTFAADQKKLEEERKKAVEEEIKRQEEIMAIRNDAVLAALDGEEKELTALKFKYEADIRGAENDKEKKLALTERYEAEKKAIEDKFAADKAKADEEAAKKAQELANKALEEQKKLDEQILEQHKKVQNLMLEGDVAANQWKYENGLQTYQEYIDNERELRLEQAELEITDLEELNERKAQINAEYNQREFEAKKQLNDDIKSAAIEAAGAIADAAFSIMTNNLNAQRDAELANKKLSEEQKAAIIKKYNEKQRKIDIAQAVVNGALAITKTFAAYGFTPAAIVAAALQAVVTAAQIAVIAKQKYALGGILQGKKHADGGVYLGNGQYAEGGEGIISAANMRNPLIRDSVLKLSTTTVQPQAQPSISSDVIADMVIKSIKEIPVTVTENQITVAQKNVEVRETRFTVA